MVSKEEAMSALGVTRPLVPRLVVFLLRLCASHLRWLKERFAKITYVSFLLYVELKCARRTSHSNTLRVLSFDAFDILIQN